MMSEQVDNVTPDTRPRPFTASATPAGPTPDPPLARMDVVDTQAMNAFDRLPPKIVPLWWDGQYLPVPAPGGAQ